MAIAFDASTASSQSTTQISFTHTPSGTPRGVLVFIAHHGNTTATEVTSVTYGGTSCTQVTDAPVIETTTPGRTLDCYFLGSSVPSGAQSAVVNVDGTGTAKIAFCVTVTAADDVSVHATQALTDAAVTTDPSTTLALTSTTCFVCQGWSSDAGAVSGVGTLTNWDQTHEHDFGNTTAGMYKYNIVGSSDVTIGVTQSPRTLALLGVALKEGAASSNQTSYPSLLNTTQFRTILTR